MLRSPARKDLAVARMSCLFLLGGNLAIGLASTNIAMLLGKINKLLSARRYKTRERLLEATLPHYLIRSNIINAA